MFKTNEYFEGKVTSIAFQGELPDQEPWQTFASGDSFEVAANEKFQLQVEHDTAYLCIYG